MASLDTFQLAPGVYFSEAATPPPPPSGVAQGVAAMVGVTQTGPFGTVTTVYNFADWVRIFGGYISENYPTYKHVKKFFLNGGGRLEFVRIAHYTDITDDTTLTAAYSTGEILDDQGTPEARINVYGKYMGSYYDDITIELSAGTNGVSGEFKIVIKLDGNKVEEFDNLSLDTTADNYFDTVVNHPNSGSLYVMLEDTVNTNPVNDAQTAVVLSGGDDGLTDLDKDDYIGDSTAETGIELFGQVDQGVNICVPDATVNDTGTEHVDIIKGIDAFIQARHNTSFQIVVVPEGKTPIQAITWMTSTLALDSPYYAAYYEFLVDSDDGILISPGGAICGLYARYANSPNKGVWWSPAGYEAQLLGFSGLERKVNGTNLGLLNQSRINAIKIITGKGVTVYGSRTGTISRQAHFKYIGARKNTSDIEDQLRKNTQWAPQRPNDAELWRDITLVANSILRNRWIAGGLDGNGKGESWRVVCNSSVNTQQTKNQGLVVCKVGIWNKQTAEFIWFNIDQLNTGSSVSEG